MKFSQFRHWSLQLNLSKASLLQRFTFIKLKRPKQVLTESIIPTVRDLMNAVLFLSAVPVNSILSIKSFTEPNLARRPDATAHY